MSPAIPSVAAAPDFGVHMSDETESSAQCGALTKKGTPCPAPPTATGRCYLHSIDREQAAELGRRGGLKNRHVRPYEMVELPPLDTAEDVRLLLANVIADVRNRRVEPRVATSISQIASTLLKAIEVADLEARLNKLEGASNNGSQKTD